MAPRRARPVPPLVSSLFSMVHSLMVQEGWATRPGQNGKLSKKKHPRRIFKFLAIHWAFLINLRDLDQASYSHVPIFFILYCLEPSPFSSYILWTFDISASLNGFFNVWFLPPQLWWYFTQTVRCWILVYFSANLPLALPWRQQWTKILLGKYSNIATGSGGEFVHTSFVFKFSIPQGIPRAELLSEF